MRVAFPVAGDEPEEIASPTRRFSLLKITSRLPDDSREEDERQEERRVRELRSRVKVARAVVSRTPGLVDVLARDLGKAARFYARLEITQGMFRHGVPAICPEDADLGADVQN